MPSAKTAKGTLGKFVWNWTASTGRLLIECRLCERSHIVEAFIETAARAKERAKELMTSHNCRPLR